MPSAFTNTFTALANEPVIRRATKGLVLEKAIDYAPKATDADYVRKSDVPWLDRFAAAGGRAIISGDVNMRIKHHEKLCLYHHGLVGIFFEKQWNGRNSFRKTALLLHWWEEVAAKIKTADRGTFWVIPTLWPPKGGSLRNVSLGLAELLRDISETDRAPRQRKRIPLPPSKPTAQTNMLDILDGSHVTTKAE
nr:hypothetical protein [uncultured Rhodopila sp.]